MNWYNKWGQVNSVDSNLTSGTINGGRSGNLDLLGYPDFFRGNSMKVALYARVSTDKQARKYSIPAQLDLLRVFARTNNHEVFREYVDREEPESGVNLV